MDLKSLALKALMDKLGGGVDTDAAGAALDDVVGDGNEFDLGSLVAKFTGGGGDVAEIAKSWLGDGDNAAISADQVKEAIGDDKVAAFASKLGIDKEQASSQLSELLPDLIDKSSSGGNLLASLVGGEGLKGLASKFLK